MAVILHVDMDAFFASVEQLHHPEWRGKPLVVGAGPHDRGVVSTCSYEARRYGIRSAMPSRTAYERCPHAVFTPPHMELYEEVSAKAFEVFSHYSPYIEAVSIDEAFLDVTGSVHLHGTPRALGEALRAEIRRTCGVTCSVGLAPNRLLAKIGSELNKPDGLTLMPFDPKEVAAFLAPRPIGILWGVGRKTIEALRPYGLATCGDLQRLTNDALVPREILDMAFGRSEEFVYWQESDEKSVSREHTFSEDVSDRETVRRQLLELVADVGRRFRTRPRWAKTARLKIRDAAFVTTLRQQPFAQPSCDDIALRAAALALFDDVWHDQSVRLIGFGVTNFTDSPEATQLSLFEEPDDAKREKRERLSRTLDALHDRGLSVS